MSAVKGKLLMDVLSVFCRPVDVSAQMATEADEIESDETLGVRGFFAAFFRLCAKHVRLGICVDFENMSAHITRVLVEGDG